MKLSLYLSFNQFPLLSLFQFYFGRYFLDVSFMKFGEGGLFSKKCFSWGNLWGRLFYMGWGLMIRSYQSWWNIYLKKKPWPFCRMEGLILQVNGKRLCHVIWGINIFDKVWSDSWRRCNLKGVCWCVDGDVDS